MQVIIQINNLTHHYYCTTVKFVSHTLIITVHAITHIMIHSIITDYNKKFIIAKLSSELSKFASEVIELKTGKHKKEKQSVPTSLQLEELVNLETGRIINLTKTQSMYHFQNLNIMNKQSS